MHFVEQNAQPQQRHGRFWRKPQGGPVILLGFDKVTDCQLHLRRHDKRIEQIGLRLEHSDRVLVPAGLRQNPAQMDLHMRLLGTRGRDWRRSTSASASWP
jgi:hypothetical protein